ncbi:hypothetical protein MHYP_G00346090 [Metynnis hypsauchen]
MTSSEQKQIKTPSAHFGLINCVIPEQELGGLAGFLDGGSSSTVSQCFRGREAGRRLCCLIGHGYRDVRTAEGQAVRGNTKADVTASQELKPETPLSHRPADSVRLRFLCSALSTADVALKQAGGHCASPKRAFSTLSASRPTW